MNELVYLKRDDAFTDSLIISTGTNVEHRKIKAVIKKHEKKLKEFGKLSAPCRAESTGGRPEEYYPLNEAQATFLITLLKNTDVVVNFKAELVKEFIKMRRFIAEKQTAAWIETRQQGKLTRKAETDIIKQLVEYAKEQGSTHSDMLYVTYTKLANKIIGVHHREDASTMQLNNLSLAEHIIKNVIDTGIQSGMYYKDIYKESKKRLELFSDVAMLEVSA